MELLNELLETTVVSSGVENIPYLAFVKGELPSTERRLWIDSDVTTSTSDGEVVRATTYHDDLDLSSLVGLTVESVTLDADSGLRVSFGSGVSFRVEGLTLNPPWWVS